MSGGDLAGLDDARADPTMRCVLCLKPIPEGTGHYRIVEGRFQVECLEAYWPRPSTR